jgi:predicted RNA-binding protein with PUA-like domain
MMSNRRFWLVKSEEEEYSIDDLARDGSAAWTGVRNYEARNLMRDSMSDGDGVVYYHSNASPPGVAGIARVQGEPYPDPTQFDETSRYFDPKATPEDPRWWLVDIAFVEKFPRLIPLRELKEDPRLAEMVLLNRMRLSVQPVSPGEFSVLEELARKD